VLVVEVMAAVLMEALALLIMVAEEVAWLAVTVTLVVVIAGPSSTTTSVLRGVVLFVCSIGIEEKDTLCGDRMK
jgi:hypothetical protein